VKGKQHGGWGAALLFCFRREMKNVSDWTKGLKDGVGTVEKKVYKRNAQEKKEGLKGQ
jgi:hypothetical protein